MSKKERSPAQLAHDAEQKAVFAEARNIVAQKKAMGDKKSAKSSYEPKKKTTRKPKNESFDDPPSVAAAYSSGFSSKKPLIFNEPDKVTITHRELLTSIIGSVGFTVALAVALNPGISGSFPWLSTVAQAWEQYRFKRLKVDYFTRTGSNTPGSMLLIPDYNAADDAPDSEQIALAYQDAVEDAPWKNICCKMFSKDLHPNGQRKYIRTAPLADNLDIKTYDAGNIYLCTTDGTAVTWGKVFIEYEVELFVAQLNPTGVTASEISAGYIINGGTTSSANPLGSAPTFNANNYNVTFDGSSHIFFQFPGVYLVGIGIQGTGLAIGSNIPNWGFTITTSLTGSATIIDQLVLVDGTGGLAVYQIATFVPNCSVTVVSSATTTTFCSVFIGTGLPNVYVAPAKTSTEAAMENRLLEMQKQIDLLLKPMEEKKTVELVPSVQSSVIPASEQTKMDLLQSLLKKI